MTDRMIKPGDEIDFGDGVSWLILKVYPSEVKLAIYRNDVLLRKTSVRKSWLLDFIREAEVHPAVQETSSS